MSSAAPRVRRAWAPGADVETAAVLRTLARNPWLFAGRDDADIAIVRRNENAIRDTLARLGWVVVVERDLVRLRKSPPPRPEQWAADGPSPQTCSWFFLAVAAAESMPPRCGLGQLVTAARAAAAEAGLPSLGDMTERRAILAALKMLGERGVIRAIDGDLDGFLHDEDAPVLLAVHHTRLTHVVANPGISDPSADPAMWLAQAHREPDAARRMRRRLIDDTCVHVLDLDEAEADWLSRRVRADDGAPLAAAFGLSLERRSEGAAFIVPDEAFRFPRELGPMAFPTPGTIPHAALLLCDHADAFGSTDGPAAWRTLTSAQVIEAMAAFAAANAAGKGGWAADLAADPVRLSAEVQALLLALNLLRVEQGEDGPLWLFTPTAGRWMQPGSASANKKKTRTSTITAPTLFEQGEASRHV